jgi:Fic family protein
MYIGLITMQNISYKEKIEALIKHYRFSTKLAEALKVHRMSIQNWRDDDTGITETNRLKIDTLYALHCIIPVLDKKEVTAQVRNLEREDHTPFLENIDITIEISKRNAFGSLEIESIATDEKTFYQIVEGSYIEKDIDKRTFLEMNNLAFLTKQIMLDTQEGRLSRIDDETIKKWHFGLMQGIRDDAGRYSTKVRIIPDTKITLTLPEDIPEEMHYWTKKYATVKSIEEIALAHEHFELIHPFGDGNGRIGRLIMVHQFLTLGILPPLIDRHNKALYYAALEKAQTKGNIVPLLYCFVQAVERMKRRIGLIPSSDH